MKSSTILDSIAFQLTPTRTRCDLMICANGKTEKIASGLLDPFLAHLKAAQEQIGKGGYSIVIEPNRGRDNPWFTKGTVERFVRFVSNPGILERAYTIESEILQIEKAISLQSSNDTSLHNAVELPVKSEESLEGSKPVLHCNEEKAIVLYQPSNHQAEDGPNTQEKNSKAQLVQVLETRKSALQKEQGMAFARAFAASFDINNICELLAFAESFGASRMMDACKKFVHLWKAKHESGQWVEVEATEAMSFPADVPSTNPSGIVFHSSNESSQGEASSERNGKSDHHHQSQQNPMFAPWQMNSPANGMPMPQPYPMQGMPYYQNYPGNMFFSPPYPPLHDPRLHPGLRRHSVDSGDMSDELETQEAVTSGRQRNRGDKSSKKRSGTVVIRNINYIASTKQGSGDSDDDNHDDDDDNDADADADVDDHGHDYDVEFVKGDETRKIRKKEVSQISDNPLKSSGRDDGHWQAFQNFLLTDNEENSNSVNNNMFAMEGKVQGRKRQTLDNDMDYILNRQDKLTAVGDSSLDPVISNVFQGSAVNNKRGSLHTMADDSFVVPRREGSLDRDAGDGRDVMDMDYQLPLMVQEAHSHTVGTSQSNYEPNELNLIPNREMEDGLSGYDPAVDYEMQAQVKERIQQSGNSQKVASGTKQGPKKTVKDQKLRAERLPARREKPSKLSLSEDARARAEKLRAYKADLQKLKKEKEDEQLKRLEALKIERQKRIAARSGATVPQSPSASQQGRKQVLKLSPISQKGSKFSDAEPGSSSPLQRSTLKLLPRASSDSIKITKPVKSNSGSQSNGNKLTRSASSLSVRHEDNNCPTPESKATMSRIRRLSEPKSTAHLVSSGKTRSAEGVSRRRVSTRTDTAKSESLPEQKLRASKGSSVPIKKELTNKEKSQKLSEKMLSVAPVASNLSRGDGDDNAIVEKTVVMLESKKSVPAAFQQPLENKSSSHDMQLDRDKDVDVSEEDTSIPPPASPIIVKEVDCEPSRHTHTCVNESDEVSPNLPNVDTAEEPYRAPYARVSSREDPCMAKSEYGKALPTSFSTAVIGVQVQMSSALVSDGHRQDSANISQAASGKHQGKDSVKGFRRLLKFGKRSSAGSESSIELDKTTLEGVGAGDNALNNSSSEVFTLKNLLIQEESSSAATTPKKSSRPFSLLSPFKRKNTEKKATP